MTGLRADSPLVRLLAGGAIVGVVLVVLWQAGLLFSSGEGGGGEGLPDLAEADASIDTPNPLGLEVGLRPGNVAPDFEFSDYRGRRARLSDFRGGPVFINFWASWCIPCRAELPDIDEVQRMYQARSLTILGVNNGESYSRGSGFLEELGIDMDAFAFAFDPNSDIVRRYAVSGMPTSYFIDADGVITAVFTGAISRRIMQSAIEEAIIGWGKVQAPSRR